MQSDSGALSSLIGGNFLGQKTGTGAITTMIAANVGLQSTNVTGTVTTMQGLNVGQILGNQVTSGTITNAMMVNVGGWSTGPTFTNTQEQLRLSDGSANGIALRQIGSAETNRLNGNLRVGADSAPGAAFVDYAAGTTSNAQANYEASTAPSSPVEGDLWNDSTQKTRQVFVNGVKQSIPGVLFTQTATATFSNTGTATSVIGSGVGAMTLPANFFVAGKTFRLVAAGFGGSDAAAPGTMTIRLRVGNVVTTSLAVSITVVNWTWYLDTHCTCRTTGVTGTIWCNGVAGITNNTTANTFQMAQMNNGGTDTVDTTGTLLVDVTGQFGTVDADNSMNGTTAILEVLN